MHRRKFCVSAASALTMLLGSRPASSARPAISVDSHAHTFLHTLPMVPNRRYTPDYDAGLAAYLAMLQTDGSTHGVLVQPSFLGFDNSYLLAALDQHPDRLRGIVVVEPGTPRKTLEAFHRRGVVGVRLNLIGEPDPDFSEPAWRQHLDTLAALEWQVEVQAEARRLKSIIATMRDAGITLVVDHFGRPDKVLGTRDPGFRALLQAAETGQIYVKLSGPYRLGPGERGYQIANEAAPILLKAFGSERLVWGSDWPHTEFEKTAPGPQEARAELDGWVTDESQRHEILSSTPAALFKFNTNSKSIKAEEIETRRDNASK